MGMADSNFVPENGPLERKNNFRTRLSYIGRRFPPLAWLGKLLYPIWWVFEKIGSLFFSSSRKRKLNKRRRRSNWTVRRARLRMWLARRSPPQDAHIAYAAPVVEGEPDEPVSKGFSRLVTLTALSSVAVLAFAVLYLIWIWELLGLEARSYFSLIGVALMYYELLCLPTYLLVAINETCSMQCGLRWSIVVAVLTPGLDFVVCS